MPMRIRPSPPDISTSEAREHTIRKGQSCTGKKACSRGSCVRLPKQLSPHSGDGEQIGQTPANFASESPCLSEVRGREARRSMRAEQCWLRDVPRDVG